MLHNKVRPEVSSGGAAWHYTERSGASFQEDSPLIIKLDGLTAEQFAALTAFLASDKNELENLTNSPANSVALSIVVNPPILASEYPVVRECPSKFASLITAKGKHKKNVVLEVETWYHRLPNEYDINLVDPQHRTGVRDYRFYWVVPASYLFQLFESIGLFPERCKGLKFT